MVRIIEFSRHGQSGINSAFVDLRERRSLPKDLPGDKNTRLTSLGEEQAVALGEAQAARYHDVPGSSIVARSSDFERARQTAQIAVARINADRPEENRVASPTVDPRLGEVNLGLADPAYVNKFPELYEWCRQAYLDLKNDPLNQRPAPHLSPRLQEIADMLGLKGVKEREGQAIKDLGPQLTEWLKDFLLVLQGEKTHGLIYAHGGVAWASRLVILHESLEQLSERMQEQKKAGVPLFNGATFTYEEKPGGWTMSEENWNKQPPNHRR